MPSTIMIVGADRNACTSLAERVQAETGLRGAVATTASDARSMCQAMSNDLAMAIIDARLPDAPGHTLCADLLAERASLPVMMVSPGYDEADTARGLEAGAIDVFHRPHNRAELLARLRAHLRTQSRVLNTEIAVGPLCFLPGQRMLLDKRTGRRVFLTTKETLLLRRLHTARGRPVGKADLLLIAWDPARATLHTVHTHVYRLRTKLEAGGAGRILDTTRDGYVLRV